MVKNHPFQNGNKRIAVTTIIIFLLLNDRWISVLPDKLYHLAVWVAESDPDLRDAVVLGLRDFIAKYAKKVRNRCA
jgi:prophage maintenance system killer protein